MKLLIGVILLVSTWVSHADTVGPGCEIVWDYPVDDEQLIDGFRIYQGSIVAGTAQPSNREIACIDAGVVAGVNTVTATAYNVVGESIHSDPLTFVFVDTAPAAPENIRIIVSIP